MAQAKYRLPGCLDLENRAPTQLKKGSAAPGYLMYAMTRNSCIFCIPFLLFIYCYDYYYCLCEHLKILE